MPNGQTEVQGLVHCCAWCYQDFPKGRMIENRFCSTECKREMRGILKWDSEPLKSGFHNRPHYKNDWAWQTKKFRQEGEPGNIGKHLCGWQRRDHKHE